MFNTSEFLNRSLNIAKMIISQKLTEGDIAVDATSGNGNDTLFLANIVGCKGKVYSFDIQDKAIENTKRLLENNNISNSVEIVHDGHEFIDKYVKEKVKVVVFNLGYLPGSDKKISTKAETTILAIKKSLDLLVEGGLILLVVYYGHPTGTYEKEEVCAYSAKLDKQKYNVFHLEFTNQDNNPPILIGIEKRVF
ncbi:MAG: class I SAM-dependent methyltransferase [Candidatus Omnitrophica bacterium]|nr:class I SAM-dependent methyltransferase [Candidatus Omnitrophota bacterium]MBU4332945.1 class I SAM-dependent methyltransferase [Candidatus Omnitrophota bacterium]